ncbi:hypothetical protein BD414DRAFT_483220 [Trametes punicea]|nr:hypothetical protein BD414DRAFT_483220 [Trametes punicea]
MTHPGSMREGAQELQTVHGILTVSRQTLDSIHSTSSIATFVQFRHDPQTVMPHRFSRLSAVSCCLAYSNQRDR